MSNALNKIMPFVLKWEVGLDKKGNLREDGGYTNDPDDPGGETKWGISKRANPDLDIANLTLQEAIDTYKNKYWDIYKTKPVALDLDEIPIYTAAAVFDSGINCGVDRAYKWYQKGTETKNPAKVVLGLRDAYYFDLVSGNPSKWTKFYKGWINRLTDLKKFVDVLRLEAENA